MTESEGDMTDKKLSLVEHAKKAKKDAARARCPACKLSRHVRAQIVEAKVAGVTNKEIVAWLEEVHDVTVTTQDLLTHGTGRHDE